MVVVTFKLHGKPGNLVEINQSLKGIAERVKKLDGCVDTKVYQDIDDESIFFLVEEWQKQRESGGLSLDVTGAENYTTILTISPSPVEQDEIWVGTDDGRIHVTTDGGDYWASVENNVPGVPPNTWIPHIEPSRFKAGTAFVVFDDHRRANWQTYLFRTTDHGKTWTSLATDDVRGYALSIAQDPVDPNLLFLGTEFGLWFSVDGGDSWLRFKGGVPTVSVMALEVHPRDHDLIVGTHGRAAFVIDDISPLRGLTSETLKKSLHVFPVADTQQYRVKQTGASRFPGNGEFRGANRPYGAMINVIVNGDDLPHPDDKNPSGSSSSGDGEDGDGGKPKAKIEIEVLDDSDERVCQFEASVVQGLNRVTWNLRRDEFRMVRDPERRGPRGRGPRGPEVPAGSYRVITRFGDQEVEHPVRVLPDPRTPVSDEARAAKWEAILMVGGWQETLTECLERLVAARADVDFVKRKIRAIQAQHEGDDEKPHQDLMKAAKELSKKIDTVEASLRGPRDVQGIAPRDHVSSKIRGAMRSLPSSWDAPDDAQLRYMEVGRAALEKALVDVNQVLQQDVTQFRAAVEEADIQLFPPHDEISIK